jgi:hypothetical protein
MPFDALVAAPRQIAIQDALDTLGLTPVGLDKLAEHKLAQQKKFGPSFWFRHQTAVSMTLIAASPVIGAVVGALQGFTPHSSALAVASSFIWMCVVALLTGTGLVKLRAGAYWEERYVPGSALENLEVPPSIVTVARSVQRIVPDAGLVLGELKRHEAVLDPYLLIETGTERVCLGIWENGKIIAATDQH